MIMMGKSIRQIWVKFPLTETLEKRKTKYHEILTDEYAAQIKKTNPFHNHYTGGQSKRQLVDMPDKKLPLILVYIHYTGCQNKRQLVDMADKKLPLI